MMNMQRALLLLVLLSTAQSALQGWGFSGSPTGSEAVVGCDSINLVSSDTASC